MSSATILHKLKPAARIGEELLAELGCRASLLGQSDHPALAWRRAGLFALSGHKDGPARMVPLPLATFVDGALLALKSLSGDPEKLPINGSLLLGERARILDMSRNGRASPSGHCRLIDARQGRFALNLARDDDWTLLEAWLEEPATTWGDVGRIAKARDAAALVQRGAEIGLAISLDQLPGSQPWFAETAFPPVRPGRARPLVADLSSLWAGPLASNLLQRMGAHVVKVESISRPDGARRGNTEFYHLLNGGKRCAAFDFAAPDGRRDLQKLLAAADIVIEGSRPRALRQLGIDAEQLLAQKPGKVWLRLAAYGDDETRVGFGEDIGVAAGLSTIMEQAWGKPFFAGDAIADPVSGILAALAAWTKWQAGGGSFIRLSMRDAVARAIQLNGTGNDWPSIASEWQALAEADDAELYPMRQPSAPIEQLGASTRQIMDGLC